MLFLGQIALKEHDEKQLYLARQHIVDLRNLYAVITDLIQKNISKASEQIGTHVHCTHDLRHRFAHRRLTIVLAYTRYSFP
jgi:hypothetical protein